MLSTCSSQLTFSVLTLFPIDSDQLPTLPIVHCCYKQDTSTFLCHNSFVDMTEDRNTKEKEWRERERGPGGGGAEGRERGEKCRMEGREWE